MGMNLNVSFEEVWIKKVRRKLIVVKFIHKSTKLKNNKYHEVSEYLRNGTKGPCEQAIKN